MSAIFNIKINSIYTTDIGDLNGVIKKVDFTVIGTKQDSTFELPQTVDLSDPENETFKPLAELAESDVRDWIENSFTLMDGVKAHIQYVLDKEVAKKALTTTSLPWNTEE
jgi:hypothetical protein